MTSLLAAIDALRAMLRRGQTISADEKGAAMTEYVVLLGTVGLAVAVSIAGLGPVLLASFQRARGILMAPFP